MRYDFDRFVFFALFVFLAFDADFCAGTFLPSFRASERPIAIACFRLVTFLPNPPLFNVPFFRLCIARATFFAAPFEYFRAIVVSAMDCRIRISARNGACSGTAEGGDAAGIQVMT
ncbi:MAG: hypothetical protein IJ935_02565 [Afipia sp.]|nr:hypothetical protein [Afipia sp.]